mgnify:CR=1 FL=1
MENETKEKILDLYESGKSVDKIAEEDVDYHKSTVYRKVKEAGVNRSQSEAAQQKELSEEHKKAISEGLNSSDKDIGSKAAELKDGYEESTEDLAYFLGVMAGDGYIVSQGGIGLENKDKELVDAFASALENQFGFEPQIYKKKADEMEDWRTGKTHERSERWILRKKSVNLQDFCQSISENWILDKDGELKKTWVRGLWDSDGCINHHSQQVYFYNKDIRLIEIYEKILDELFGIEASHYIRQGDVYLCYFGQKDQIETFYKEIKPTIQRKRDNFQKILGLDDEN